MPFCAVWTCRESGPFACKKSEGQIISFHRFPTDRRIKAKWIKATGQLKTMSSWRPKKNSTICSKHFKKEDFLDCTELKPSAVPICEEEQGGITKDSVDSSETESVDDATESPQHNQSITDHESTKEDEEIPNECKPAAAAPTTPSHDQPESSQPISVQDSEPEVSETSSELEFTELDSSEAKSDPLSVDAIENPQESQAAAYGMKISNVYSTRKRTRSSEEIKGQMKTNTKMYRIDPATNTVRPITSITSNGFIIEPSKRFKHSRTLNRLISGKPIYLLKQSIESLDGDSQKTKANRNDSSQVQYANITTKNIAPETESNSNRVVTLSMYSEEQKRVYSTPVPKLAQINPELSSEETDVHTIWKATKLNPTMETADRVKNPQKIKLKSSSKNSPSAYMSKAPNGEHGFQLTLRNKPKPRLAPAIRKPTTSVAAPVDSMRTSIVSTTSTVSIPTPAADSTPSLADSMTVPADSTPTTADSMPKIADTVPTPAVTSAAVQRLYDSSIHTLDEYDTFAKHVATQLRQLSLESYLSAQKEIQSILSRFRLRELSQVK